MVPAMSGAVVNLRDYRDPRDPRRFLLPPDVVRIDRQTRYGNPYRIDPRHPRDVVISQYRAHLAELLTADPMYLEPLRGHRLACWCAPLPCHGDVIAEYLGTAP